MEKKLATELEQIHRTYPHGDVQLWCEDEHRLGLKPIIRRIYLPEGCQPIANVNWKFEWLWLYAFVHPKTGETYWWILPDVNTKLFNRVLREFAAELNWGENKHILLVVDQAGWHTSQTVELLEGLHLTS